MFQPDEGFSNIDKNHNKRQEIINFIDEVRKLRKQFEDFASSAEKSGINPDTLKQMKEVFEADILAKIQEHEKMLRPEEKSTPEVVDEPPTLPDEPQAAAATKTSFAEPPLESTYPPTTELNTMQQKLDALAAEVKVLADAVSPVEWIAITQEPEFKGLAANNMFGDRKKTLDWIESKKKHYEKEKRRPALEQKIKTFWEQNPQQYIIANSRVEDYYQILGLPQNATDQQIEAALRKLRVQYHPDGNMADFPDNDPLKLQFNRIMQNIAQAEHVLLNPNERSDYQFQLNIAPAIDRAQYVISLQRVFDTLKKIENEYASVDYKRNSRALVQGLRQFVSESSGMVFRFSFKDLEGGVLHDERVVKNMATTFSSEIARVLGLEYSIQPKRGEHDESGTILEFSLNQASFDSEPMTAQRGGPVRREPNPQSPAQSGWENPQAAERKMNRLLAELDRMKNSGSFTASNLLEQLKNLSGNEGVIYANIYRKGENVVSHDISEIYELAAQFKQLFKDIAEDLFDVTVVIGGSQDSFQKLKIVIRKSTQEQQEKAVLTERFTSEIRDSRTFGGLLNTISTMDHNKFNPTEQTPSIDWARTIRMIESINHELQQGNKPALQEFSIPEDSFLINAIPEALGLRDKVKELIKPMVESIRKVKGVLETITAPDTDIPAAINEIMEQVPLLEKARYAFFSIDSIGKKGVYIESKNLIAPLRLMSITYTWPSDDFEQQVEKLPNWIGIQDAFKQVKRNQNP